MINWRSISNLQIFKTLNIKKNANLVLTKQAGTEVTLDPDEVTNQLDSGGRVVTHIAASSLTRDLHANGKINFLSLLAGFDTTLPEATGSGDSYFFQIGIVNTTNDYGILALTTDIMTGSVVIIDTDTVADSATGFATAATSDKIEINGTTQGGLTIGDWVEFRDLADATWSVRGILTGSGTIETPFDAT